MQRDYYILYLRAQLAKLLREKRYDLSVREKQAYELLCGAKKSSENLDLLPEWLQVMNLSKKDTECISTIYKRIAPYFPAVSRMSRTKMSRNGSQDAGGESNIPMYMSLRKQRRYIVLSKDRIDRINKIVEEKK